jgi:hypothetical protein
MTSPASASSSEPSAMRPNASPPAPRLAVFLWLLIPGLLMAPRVMSAFDSAIGPGWLTFIVALAIGLSVTVVFVFGIRQGARFLGRQAKVWAKTEQARKFGWSVSRLFARMDEIIPKATVLLGRITRIAFFAAAGLALYLFLPVSGFAQLFDTPIAALTLRRVAVGLFSLFLSLGLLAGWFRWAFASGEKQYELWGGFAFVFAFVGWLWFTLSPRL